MDTELKLTWLGHACFLLEEGGCRLLLDPYEKVDGYGPLQLEAHRLLCSHAHFDHACRSAVKLLPGPTSPFTVEEISSFHDDRQGALRGTNTIHVISDGRLRCAHLGDLGVALSEEQLEKLGRVDILLLPVGGVYTIGPEEAFAVAQAVGAKAVFPMHARWGKLGFPQLRDVEDFLALYPAAQVCRLPGSSWAGPLPREQTAFLPTLSGGAGQKNPA